MSGEKFFKCLANETRLRCLMLLQARESLCVCDIAGALGVSQPMISRHLAQLRAADVVSDHREGQWVYYRLHNELKPWQRSVLSDALAGPGGDRPYTEDLTRLMDIEGSNRDLDCP